MIDYKYTHNKYLYTVWYTRVCKYGTSLGCNRKVNTKI